MLDPLLNATASAKLPESLFDGITTYASPWQRIVYSVFLTNILFLTLDTNCGDSAVGSIILGVNVNSSVINSSVTNSSVTNSSVTNVSTGEIHLAFQQFRMVCGEKDTTSVALGFGHQNFKLFILFHTLAHHVLYCFWQPVPNAYSIKIDLSTFFIDYKNLINVDTTHLCTHPCSHVMTKFQPSPEQCVLTLLEKVCKLMITIAAQEARQTIMQCWGEAGLHIYVYVLNICNI